jgi:putative ABC transport system permease protein
MYSAVLEKSRELGVLKAVGASTRDLAVVVLTQAGVASGAGYVLGVALSVLAGRATEAWVPQFVTTLRAGDIALVAIAVVGMAAVAALAPLGRLSRIDPAEAFRS